MKVSAIFVSFNGLADLQAALPTLRAQTYLDEIEIIVVDNASADKTTQWSRAQHGVRVVTLRENRGYAAGVNAGIRAASGDCYLQLNTDLLLEPYAVDRLVRAIDTTTRREVVSCRFKMPDGRVQPYSYAAPSLLHLPANLVGAREVVARLRWLRPLSAQLRDYLSGVSAAGIRDVQVLSGACMLYTRSVVERIGELDEAFFLGPDDWDFCDRAREAGYRLGLIEEPLVTHVGGMSSRREHGRPYPRVFYGGWVYYHRKHGGRAAVAGLCLFLAAALPIQVLRKALRMDSSERPADVRLMFSIAWDCIRWLWRPLP